MEESHMHYMECKAITPTKLQKEKSDNLHSRMKKAGVYDGITTCLLWGIRWYKGKKPLNMYQQL